jgi:acyl-CoA dehydrogenase family protein 9
VGPLYFKDVRVPPENLLGEPGDGFRIAMRILENGRLTIAAGAIGCGRRLIDLALDHCATRRAFGGVLADLELVQEKLAWMMATRHALKAITSLTAALDDDPGFSCTLETAICKILGTDFLVGAANRALDLRGGAGYLVDEPYERLLRDVRVMPIFEGSNDVLRGWIPLLGIRAFLAHLQGSSHNGGAPPAEFERLHQHAQRFAERTQQLLIQHGEAIRDRQLELRRLCEALIELYAQAAIISRRSPSEGDRERASAELFLAGSDRRIDEALSSTAAETDDRVRRLAGSALRERGDELMSH